jgi:ABC-type proline/glycine betaine transport system ATPase subunit/ABC-type sulfate transport system permease component
MMQRTPQPLIWLAALLAAYLCAPFLASISQIRLVDWQTVDWSTLMASIGVSVGSATVAAGLIALGGIPLGYFLARSSSRWMTWLGFVVQLPLALPPLTSGILLLFLLGSYSVIGRAAAGALTNSFAGIVLAQTFVAAPFLIIAARSAFAAVDPILEDVAATLGHQAQSRFFHVSLPLAWPGIRAGLLLAWLRAFGEFGATVMVAYHPYSLPVYTYVAFGSQGLSAMMPLLLPTLVIAIAFSMLASFRGWTPVQPRESPVSDEEGGDLVVAGSPPLLTHSGSLAFEFRKRLGNFELDVAWAPTARRLAILGASGSGKSLILRLIAGLEVAETSSLVLSNEVFDNKAPEQRAIAYVPQDYGLFPHMTVAEQLAFPIGADAIAARYWITHLGLSGLTGRRPVELSIGQRQRVALARALVRPSRLILLDEPFSALDTPRRRRLRRSLRQLQTEIDATTILVTHDPEEAALLADEMLVLDGGHVLQVGRTEDLLARPANRKVAELLGVESGPPAALFAG